MANTNIQTINYSDSQNEIVNKLNNNFDEIVELHGGTRGTTGPTGPRGPIGERGPVGATGLTGPRGTRWFVTSSAPTSASQEGDYWLSSINSEIYKLTSSGWNSTGYNISSIGDLFSIISLPSIAGQAIQINQILPENYLFVLSDVSPESQILNELLSKFRISTDSEVNDSPILEFSISELENGTISEYSSHPTFSWKVPNPNDYSMVLKAPKGFEFLVGPLGNFSSAFENFTIETTGGGVEIQHAFGGGETGSIFATGGYEISTPDQITILSSNFTIQGGSGDIVGAFGSVVTTDSSIPHTRITAVGATASALRSTRTNNGNHGNLSHTVFHLNMESFSDSELFLSTKGKLRTKKTTEGVTYSPNSPSYQTSGGGTSPNAWYFISKTSTPYSTQYPSVPLDYGNNIVINPAVTSDSFIGIGFDNSTDFSWGGSGGLQVGESIDITVHNSSDSLLANVLGFKYIGYGTGGTGGTAYKQVTLPFYANTVDFTLARISNTTNPRLRVHWKAYTPWGTITSTGGTGGTFEF